MSNLNIVIDPDLIAEILVEDLGDEFSEETLSLVACRLIGDLSPCLNSLARHLIEEQGLEDTARELAEFTESGAI